MKKVLLCTILIVLFAAISNGQTCTTIQQGALLYSSGSYLHDQPLKPGFDDYGYNYQAHLFVGSYFNAYANSAGFAPYYPGTDETAYLSANPGADSYWAWPYRSITVNMKWNDAWLSNKDCDSDQALDRHYGFASYSGSGAWLTNHQSDTDSDGNHWTDFVKIVAVPAGSQMSGSDWSLDSTVIGPAIWGDFAIIQEVYNDPAADVHGVLSKSPLNPGFGYYGNQ